MPSSDPFNARRTVDTVLTLSGGIVAEDLNFKRVLVGRISVRELHRIFEEHGDRLLERNVRRFLGHANRINMDIRDTLLDPEKSSNFYFYHDAIVRSLQRGPHIDTVLTLSGGIVAEDLNFKRVLVGRIPVRELHRIFEEHGDRLLERNVRRFSGTRQPDQHGYP